jgi:hypothetical protein
MALELDIIKVVAVMKLQTRVFMAVSVRLVGSTPTISTNITLPYKVFKSGYSRNLTLV